jgi:hypothetical protein
VTRKSNVKIEENDRVFRLTSFQSRFAFSKARYPAYVGGWGTGKSLCGIVRAMDLSTRYKDNLGVIFRKEFVDLKDSTCKDFETYTGLKISSTRDVKVGSSTILFRHLEEMNNIQNMNLGWFWIEQAEELEIDDYFFKLFGRLRRKGCEQSGFITANTNGHNWIYKLWKQGKLEDAELTEAKTFDNVKNLDEKFIQSLEQVKKSKPKIYAQFVENSWDETENKYVIVQSSWVDAAKRRDLLIRPPIRRIVSIDVARGGSDKSVFYAIENYKVLAKEQHETRNTMELVGLAQIFAKNNGKIEAYAVDEIGVGAGVADRLQELKKHVIMVNAAQRENVPDSYFNRRSQIYGEGAEMLEAGKVQILPDDDDLAEQLTWTRWRPIRSNMQLQAQSKDEVIQEFGRSPDDADSFLNGLWALQYAPVAVVRDGYHVPATKYRFNPDTV